MDTHPLLCLWLQVNWKVSYAFNTSDDKARDKRLFYIYVFSMHALRKQAWELCKYKYFFLFYILFIYNFFLKLLK